jgi:hypothetical protein
LPATPSPFDGSAFAGTRPSVGGGGAGALTSALSEGGLGVLTSQLGPPAPASGALVAFWYGAVPALLLAVAGLFALRQRSRDAALR